MRRDCRLVAATSKKRACVGDRWCLCCMVGPPCLLEGSRVSTSFGDNNYRLQSWCITWVAARLVRLGESLIQRVIGPDDNDA